MNVKPWMKFPIECWNILLQLSDDEDTRAKLTLSIVKYLFTGQKDEYTGATKVIFYSLTNCVDKYRDIERKRSIAGKKGAQAKLDLLKQNQAKQDLFEDEQANVEQSLATVSRREKEKQEQEKKKVPQRKIEKEEEKEKAEGEKQKNKKNKKTCVHAYEDVNHEDVNAEEVKEQEKMKAEAKQFCEYWNYYIKNYPETSLKPVKKITYDRMVLIHDIYKSFSLMQIQVAIRNCLTSKFLNGKTKERTRPVDFDWIIKADNWLKAYEGNL